MNIEEQRDYEARVRAQNKGSFFDRFGNDMQANLFSDMPSVPVQIIRPNLAALATERAELFENSYKRNATTHELAQMYRMIAQLSEQKDAA